jgi:guanylate kinase
MIITLTGPSGVGKSYAKRALKDNFILSEIPVYTTRQLRTQEEEKERKHIPISRFGELILSGDIVMPNYIFWNFYGFDRSDLNNLAKSDNILELYIDNIPLFKTMYPDSISIGLFPESIEDLETRLKRRRENNWFERLQEAKYEIEKMRKYTKFFDYSLTTKDEKKVVPTLVEYIGGKLNVS